MTASKAPSSPSAGSPAAKRASRKPKTVKPDPDSLIDEKADDAPVYDERGNVRPRGTKGARPMTFEERVAIAKKTGALPTEETEGK